MELQLIGSIDKHLADLRELSRKRNVRSLFLFGSAVTSGFVSDRSDLDFIVCFQSMTPREHADAYFGLLADLESLFDRPIDLVEENAITNPYFKRAIESSRQLIYDAA